MEERDQTIGFRVSAKERQALDEEATKAGLTLTEYVRSKVLSRASTSSAESFERLLRHLIYYVNRIHVAVYSIAETAATLSTDQLQEIYDDAVQESIRYLNDLP